MGVHIGNGNKIKNSIIADEVKNNPEQTRKKTFLEKHPIICSFIISLLAGIVLLFSFWGSIITWLEGWF